MNWKFWERRTNPAPYSQEEDNTMGMYMRREETPEQGWISQLAQRQEEEERLAAAQPPPDDDNPEEPPDLLATAPPEIQAAVQARLDQERQQMRANLSRIGLDLTADNTPAFRDMSRLQQAAGWQQQQPRYEEPRQQQQAQAPPRPEPVVPVPEFNDPDDGEIPDAQYNPREYRQWLDRRNQYQLAQALNQALAPVMQAVQQIGQGTTQMYVNQAVGQVEDAVQQHMPWMAGVLDHPDFEGQFRKALTDIPPAQWQQPRDLAAVVGMIAPYLPPLPDAQFYEPQEPAPRQPSRKGRYQAQYEQAQFQEPGYLPAVPPAGPARGVPRNDRGQFVGRRAAAAAVSQAAAQQAAPSRGGGRPAVTEQYDQMILDAAARMNIPPEEARALMQDSTGDAAEQYRRKRLEALR